MPRKQATGKAVGSEMLFAATFDQAPVGMCHCATDGTLIRVNHHFAETCGYAANELVGHRLDTIFHPDDRLSGREWMRQLAGEPPPTYTFVARAATKSGATLLLQLKATPLRDDQGETQVFLCLIDDVTEQRNRAEALRLSEGKKEAILRALPDMMFVVDAEERYLDFYAANESDLFVAPDVFLGKTIREIIPEPTASVISDMVAKVLRSGSPQSAEYSLPMPAGPHHFQCRAVRCVHGVLFIVQDITAHRRALDALQLSEESLRRTNEQMEQIVHERTSELRQSEERFRTIVEDQTELIARWTPDGTVTFVNEAVSRYLSQPRHCILGTSFRSYVCEPDLPSLQAYLSSLTKDAPVSMIEHRWRLPGGSIRWTQWTHRAIFNMAGRIVEFQSVGRDITERKEAEEKLVAAERHLRQILDALFGFVGVYSVDGILLDANSAPLEAAGLTRDEVLGKPFWDTYWWNYDPAVKADVRDALARAAQGETVRYEPTVRMLGGTLMDIDCTFCPLRSATGAITGIVGFAVDITEKKRIASRNREQARLLDLIFEYSLDCIVLLDRNYNFIRVNKAYADACMRDITAFPGQNYFDLYPSSLKYEFEEVIRQGGIFRKSARPIEFPDHPELGVTYWDLGMVPIRGDHGDIELLLFTLKDVTEQKRAEEGLRASEARWHAFIDHAIDAFFIHDSADNGRIVDVNQQACEGLGYSREELIGKYPMDIDPDLTPADLAEMQSRLWADESVIFDSRHRRKDGSTFPVSVRLRAFSVQEKRFALALVRDITERRRAEQMIRDNQERLSGLVESAMDAIVSVDDEQRVLLFNPAAERLFDIRATEMLGMPLDRLLPESSRAMHAGAIRNFGLTGKTNRQMGEFGTVSGIRRDGSCFPIEASISNITVGGRKIYTAILRDITDRLRGEEILRQSLSDKDALLKEVHHRVKNNLQIINSLLNLQATKIQDPTVLAMFADSQNRVRSMALVHEMLYHSGNFGSVSLADYLTRLCTHLHRACDTGTTQVTIAVDGAAATIDLEQAIPCGLIVNELVSNALKHAFPRKPIGQIRIAIDRAAEADYILTVSDDGIGLPPENERPRGTLGLQLVADLTQQLGGKLNCEVAAGTTFRVAFPHAQPKQD